MKQVGIITHYDVHNHGALLQLTALCRVLYKMGADAKALQFEKNYDFLGHNLKTKYEISIKSVGFYLKYFRDKGLGCTWYNYKKRRTLNQYKKDSHLIGEYYSSAKELDAVFIGSDEVFALHTGPTPVFFGHGLPTDNIFSYAGSFGPTTFEEIRKLNTLGFVKSGLEGMKSITVRDFNSAEIVEKLIDKRPPIVVDPVILYGFENEISSLKQPDIPKFVLIYAYDNRMNDPEEVKFIKEYAKKCGLKTVSAGFYHEWCDYNIDIDPISLLSYFKFSDCVITDTFHGSIMSLITGARFVAKTRESNHLKLVNLLREYDVEDRIIKDWNTLDTKLSIPLDYIRVNQKIDERRAFSMKELQKMVANL